jgi:hypothetical protein
MDLSEVREQLEQQDLLDHKGHRAVLAIEERPVHLDR